MGAAFACQIGDMYQVVTMGGMLRPGQSPQTGKEGILKEELVVVIIVVIMVVVVVVVVVMMMMSRPVMISGE